MVPMGVLCEITEELLKIPRNEREKSSQTQFSFMVFNVRGRCLFVKSYMHGR